MYFTEKLNVSATRAPHCSNSNEAERRGWADGKMDKIGISCGIVWCGAVMVIVAWYTQSFVRFSFFVRIYPRLALKIFITRNICVCAGTLFFHSLVSSKKHTASERHSFQFQPFVSVMSQAYECLAHFVWACVCVCHSLSVVRTFFILFFGCHEMGHSIPIWFLFSSPDSNCSFFSLSYFVMDHFSTQFTANNNCTRLQAFEKKAKELEMKTKRHTITSRTAWKLHNSLGLCSVCVWFDINSTFVYVLWLCVWTEGMWL